MRWASSGFEDSKLGGPKDPRHNKLTNISLMGKRVGLGRGEVRHASRLTTAARDERLSGTGRGRAPRIRSPVFVAVWAMRLDHDPHELISTLPRQFCVMWQNMQCSILLHLLVPGGKWQTWMTSPAALQVLKGNLPESTVAGPRLRPR